MTDSGEAAGSGAHGARDLVTAFFLEGSPDAWLPTVVSLQHVLPDVPLVVGAPSRAALAPFAKFDIEESVVTSASKMVDSIVEKDRGHVLLITEPTIFPTNPLANARSLVDDDLRCSTVSFFSNVADFASFPHRNTPTLHQIENLDEEMITSRLRSRGTGRLPVPIPTAAGPAVLLTAQALTLIGALTEERIQLSIRDFSGAGRDRAG